MKHWKKQLGAACLVLSLLVPGSATAVVIPKDLPTIEALIALHKCIKKDEDQALGRVATSFGEQSLVTKGANKFNEVRTTLNTKMSNAHSYLVLAGAISSTANSLYMLVKVLIVSKSLYRIRSQNECSHFGKVCQCIRFSAFQTRSSSLNSGYLTMLSNRTWTTRCQVHVSRT